MPFSHGPFWGLSGTAAGHRVKPQENQPHVAEKSSELVPESLRAGIDPARLAWADQTSPWHQIAGAQRGQPQALMGDHRESPRSANALGPPSLGCCLLALPTTAGTALACLAAMFSSSYSNSYCDSN